MKIFEESKLDVIELGDDIITASTVDAGAGQGNTSGGGANLDDCPDEDE